jgi:hypothetical protein
MARVTKIMIIRRPEKPEGAAQGVDANGNDGKEFLVVQGWQRAGALVRFCAPSSAQFQRPGIDQPQSLFAAGPVSKKEKKADKWLPETRHSGNGLPTLGFLTPQIRLRFVVI